MYFKHFKNVSFADHMIQFHSNELPILNDNNANKLADYHYFVT